MAQSKVQIIKDARILAEVASIQGSDKEKKTWTPDKQSVLIWNLFRTNPALKFAAMSVEEKQKAFMQWQADWSNGRLAYPSNTARSLAEAGYAARPASEEFVMPEEVK